MIRAFLDGDHKVGKELGSRSWAQLFGEGNEDVVDASLRVARHSNEPIERREEALWVSVRRGLNNLWIHLSDAFTAEFTAVRGSPARSSSTPPDTAVVLSSSAADGEEGRDGPEMLGGRSGGSWDGMSRIVSLRFFRKEVRFRVD